MPQLTSARLAYWCAVCSLTASIALCVLWELWLAPQRAGGSWMVLKALPLLAPLFGVLHGRIYTYRWASMLMIAYFVEGCVRAYAESGTASQLAVVELALAVIFIFAAVVFVRCTARPSRPA